MILIDTPGTNDPDKKRQDKTVYNETINTVRSLTTTECQGIGSFTQCIMPDKGWRIRRTTV